MHSKCKFAQQRYAIFWVNWQVNKYILQSLTCTEYISVILTKPSPTMQWGQLRLWRTFNISVLSNSVAFITFLKSPKRWNSEKNKVWYISSYFFHILRTLSMGLSTALTNLHYFCQNIMCSFKFYHLTNFRIIIFHARTLFLVKSKCAVLNSVFWQIF